MRFQPAFAGSVLILAALAKAAVSADPALPEFTAEERAQILALAPATLPAPPADPTNRYSDSPEAARLGQRLFFDPRFSGRLMDGDNDGSPGTLGRKGETGRVSCTGCHVPKDGFLDSRTRGHAISLAAGWGRRRAPSLLDVAQARLFMWDGRRDTLYNQIFAVIESPVEMNSSRLFVAEQLARNYRSAYEKVFGRLPHFENASEFPQLTAEKTGCIPKTVDPRPVCDGATHGMPGDGAEFDHLSRRKQDQVNRAVVNMGKAIASYERKLSCGPGRFDSWAHGSKQALSVSELRGLKVFLGRGDCIRCHSGPGFSDQSFHRVGLLPRTVAVAFNDEGDPGAYDGLRGALQDALNSRGRYSDHDDGRLPSEIPEKWKGAFKTPGLRCVSRRMSFMHTGQIPDLKSVIEFLDAGGSRAPGLGASELKPLGLSDQEKGDLLEFLLALDGPGPDPKLLTEP